MKTKWQTLITISAFNPQKPKVEFERESLGRYTKREYLPTARSLQRLETVVNEMNRCGMVRVALCVPLIEIEPDFWRNDMTQKAKKYLRSKAQLDGLNINIPKNQRGYAGSLIGLGYLKRVDDHYQITPAGLKWVGLDGKRNGRG